MDINIKRKYKIDGKEYDSLEDIPAALRQAVQKAMVGWQRPGIPPRPTASRAGMAGSASPGNFVGNEPSDFSGHTNQARPTAGTPVRPRAADPSPSMITPGTQAPPLPGFIRFLKTIVFFVIVVLLFRMCG